VKNKLPKLPLTRIDFAIFLLIIIVAFMARVLPGARSIDDSFITFRYSRNIIEGNGFVYNLDSRVMGTTTPLYTLVMAGIGAVLNGRSFPEYAIAVSVIADSITACLLYLLARRMTGNRLAGVILGGLWTIAPQSVTFAIGGMETSVNVLWLTAAIYAFIEERPFLVGLFAGLGFLTRIDALLWVGPLLGWQFLLLLRESRRLPIKTWVGFAIIQIPWLIFAQFYFGTIIPRSVTAKTAVYIMPPGSALLRLIQNYGTPYSENDLIGGTLIAILVLTYLALFVIGSIYAVRRDIRLLPWLVYPIIYITAFSVANPLIFRWYLTPPLPPLMFALLVGFWAIFSAMPRSVRQNVQRIGLAALGLFWLAGTLNSWTLHPDHGNDRPAPKMAWIQQELNYRALADELVNKYGVTPASRVAAGDIGVVGYFTNATIIDTVGLVTPAMSKYYPEDRTLIVEGQNYAIPPILIHDTNPEYLIVMEAAVRYGLERDPEFKANYEVVMKIPTDFYGTDARLYKRR